MPSIQNRGDETLDPSVISAVSELRDRYPEIPFLTLGQTVLWDEPVKAAFCRILEAVAPEATMVAAIHDTDYFAKLGTSPARPAESGERETQVGAEPTVAEPLAPMPGAEHGVSDKFKMLPHNDGSTRGLWSAAGELSCLFGSETVPTRHTLASYGVAFDRVARRYPGGLRALLDEQTEAWGWRALVHVEAHPLIAADVRLADIAPALRRQLQWGFEESLRIVEGSRDKVDGAGSPAEIARRIQGWIDEFIDFDEDGTLAGLYRALTPKLWSLVRGGGSCTLHTGTSTELFRFNRSTCSLPRFRFVDLFLRGETRETAQRCYDDAVRGSGIYQLSQFGEGALPFDVVIRGRGRGTLRLHDGSLYIDTEEPIVLCEGCNCSSVAELADVLEATFGDDVVLVGKAVALISMLSAEYIFVFHEKASSYTALTQRMNDGMREAGIPLPLHPMLRLTYSTWSSLSGVDTVLRLPPHLAGAFEISEIAATDFAAGWEAACAKQDDVLADLQACGSPRELMQYLAGHGGESKVDWPGKLRDYEAARNILTGLRKASEAMVAQSETERAVAKAATEKAASAERAKGDYWRREVQPLRTKLSDLREAASLRVAVTGKLTKEERAERARQEASEEAEIATLRAEIEVRTARRHSYDSEIATYRAAAQQSRALARELTARHVAAERSGEANDAREAIGRIEYEAELERLLRARAAFVASRSLRYTNYRPTAWWFPLVSPDGAWFGNLVRGATARVEPL